MTTNAPVGPPIWTREPPNAEMMKPATIAVYSPRSGVTPLAMANAMASGSATMPTITPAWRSARSWRRVYPRSVETISGTNMASVIYEITDVTERDGFTVCTASPASPHDPAREHRQQLVRADGAAYLGRRHSRHPLHVAAESHGVGIAEAKGEGLEPVAGCAQVVVRPGDARGEHHDLRRREPRLERPPIELAALAAGDRRELVHRPECLRRAEESPHRLDDLGGRVDGREPSHDHLEQPLGEQARRHLIELCPESLARVVEAAE